jgi:hypothetical protein
LRSTYIFPWSVDRVAGINNHENSKKLKINQLQERFKVVKVNENPTLEHKNA